MRFIMANDTLSFFVKCCICAFQFRRGSNITRRKRTSVASFTGMLLIPVFSTAESREFLLRVGGEVHKTTFI